MESKRGVEKGCVLSLLLFGLYTEELAVRVRKTGLGIKVGEEVLSILLYADDVVILSESDVNLQMMLDVVTEYGTDFNIRFSSEKSQVLVVNGEEMDRDRSWTLGGMEIKRTSEYKYLGMTMDEKGCDRTKNERVARANQWVGRLGSVARCRENKYEMVRGVWKGMAVPGLNVWTRDVDVDNE